jgi:hypothetical protein
MYSTHLSVCAYSVSTSSVQLHYPVHNLIPVPIIVYEYWIEKDMGEISCGKLQGYVMAFVWGN